MKIVLIIGCFFGFGFEIVCYFFVCDWWVVVMMCKLGDDVLLLLECLCVLLFDVMNVDSICIVIEVVGLIDVFVNNVGFGVVVLVEFMLFDMVCVLFDINMIGMIVVM